MGRHASIIKIKLSELNKYKKLHEKIWPELAKIIKDCNIINYSIYYKDGFLFSYFEYIGKDFKKDMDKMAANYLTQRWWDICKPMQTPLSTRKKDEWWSEMEEIFHQE